MTITVHDAPAARVVPHVPPVPGNVPPLAENGDVKPDPFIDVAAIPPEFVNVIDLSFDEPFATAPKSYVGPFETVIKAGATPIPWIGRVADCETAPSK